MAKVHYADVERGNESNPHDEWFAEMTLKTKQINTVGL